MVGRRCPGRGASFLAPLPRLTTTLHLSVQEIVRRWWMGQVLGARDSEAADGRRVQVAGRRAARCGRSGDRPYRDCAYPSTRWGRGGLRGVGALGIAPTGIARIHRRGGEAAGCAVWALWGSPLQGLRVSIDIGVARGHRRGGCAVATVVVARWLRRGAGGVICGRGRRSGSGCWFWGRCASR
jgi:hypothetical protein